MTDLVKDARIASVAVIKSELWSVSLCCDRAGCRLEILYALSVNSDVILMMMSLCVAALVGLACFTFVISVISLPELATKALCVKSPLV